MYAGIITRLVPIDTVGHLGPCWAASWSLTCIYRHLIIRKTICGTNPRDKTIHLRMHGDKNTNQNREYETSCDSNIKTIEIAVQKKNHHASNLSIHNRAVGNKALKLVRSILLVHSLMPGLRQAVPSPKNVQKLKITHVVPEEGITV